MSEQIAEMRSSGAPELVKTAYNFPQCRKLPELQLTKTVFTFAYIYRHRMLKTVRFGFGVVYEPASDKKKKFSRFTTVRK